MAFFILTTFVLVKYSRAFVERPSQGTSSLASRLTTVSLDLYSSAWEVQRVLLGYNYQAGSYTLVVSFDLAVIPLWLEVIPQWLVVIPQQGKFKAPQPINKQCVNTQVNICEEQLGTVDCFVVWYQKLRYKQVICLYHTTAYITLHCGISLLFTLSLRFASASASCNNNDIPLVV